MTEPWMVFFLDTFFEMSTERPGGMGIMPIPASIVRQYAREYGFDGELEPEFKRLIRLMDEQFRVHHERKTRRGDTPPIR